MARPTGKDEDDSKDNDNKDDGNDGKDDNNDGSNGNSSGRHNAMAVTEELDALNALAAVVSEASELAGFHKGGA
jgi:hypothetical protein